MANSRAATGLKRLLPKNRFARSVSVLAGGTAAGQAIVVLASPLLTRLYTPEDFGVLAVFASMLSILGVVVSLRYQLAIPLPESDEEAASIAGLSSLVVVLMSALTAVLVLFFQDAIVELLNVPALSGYLWLLPVGLLLTGVYQVLNYWAIRVKAFPAISKTKLTQSAGMTVFQLGGFLLGPLALLVGRVIGQAAGSISLWKLAVPKGTLNAKALQWKNLTRAAKRYKHFPVYSSGAGLLNAGGAQIPPLFFAALFGPAAAGAYMLAQRVISIPMTVVGTAVADAFLPNAVEAQRGGQLDNEVERLFRTLAVLIFPPAAALFVLAPSLFVLAFGEEWREAGEMVRWLSPMLAIQFLINPLSRVFITLERQRLGLLLQATLFFFRSGSLASAYFLSLSTLEAVQLFSLTSAIGYFIYYIAISSLSGLNSLNALLNFVPPALVSSTLVILLYLMTVGSEGGIVRLILLVALSAAVVTIFWMRFFFHNKERYF